MLGARSGGPMACRPGALMLELAPVSPESANSMGSRSYIWDRKQTFMLSPDGARRPHRSRD